MTDGIVGNCLVCRVCMTFEVCTNIVAHPLIGQSCLEIDTEKPENL